MEILADNVNSAVDEGLHWLALAGVEENSRNGPVLAAPEPVLTTYRRPTERVLFSPLRDANPFFHLLGDALWCLAGRNDIAWPVYFNKNYEQYSDDGLTQAGAYGCRWRNYFGFDQLKLVTHELKNNPDSRRAVVTMWDGGCERGHYEGKHWAGDLRRLVKGTKDAPCNLTAMFDLRSGALNLTVCQRSGDALWGVYGANAVVFSALQEYVAAGVGASVGVYRQFSNNYHVYPATLDNNKFLPEESPRERVRQLAVDAGIHDYYKQGEVRTFPLVNTDLATWDKDLKQFMAVPHGSPNYEDIFFSTVAAPMYRAWKERKEKRGTGLEWARLIAAEDWRRACVEWIVRREARKAEK